MLDNMSMGLASGLTPMSGNTTNIPTRLGAITAKRKAASKGTTKILTPNYAINQKAFLLFKAGIKYPSLASKSSPKESAGTMSKMGM